MLVIDRVIDVSNLDNSPMDTKERLFNMLAEARDDNGNLDTMAYLGQATKVLFVLDTVQGMFSELNYCYKAKEIAWRICDQCTEFLQECQHAQTIKKIETVRNQARTLVERFNVIQSKNMGINAPS